MCFRENNNGESKRAYKPASKCYQWFSWYKLNLIHGNQHLPQARLFSKMLSIFFVMKTYPYSRLPEFTASGKVQKQELRNKKMKGNRRFKAVQGSNRSKDREIEFLNKEV